ncbi:MAG: hypothetical protein HS101_18465 [Planctomycetia bacterium]|nr:hypothetical protein [Planctomycetia bacterium]
MHNPRLCSVLLDHIRGLGYHVCRACYCDIRLGHLMICLDAVDTLDGHSWVVRAPVEREYDGIMELCKVLAIDLEDG